MGCLHKASRQHQTLLRGQPMFRDRSFHRLLLVPRFLYYRFQRWWVSAGRQWYFFHHARVRKAATLCYSIARFDRHLKKAVPHERPHDDGVHICTNLSPCRQWRHAHLLPRPPGSMPSPVARSWQSAQTLPPYDFAVPSSCLPIKLPRATIDTSE